MQSGSLFDCSQALAPKQAACSILRSWSRHLAYCPFDTAIDTTPLWQALQSSCPGLQWLTNLLPCRLAEEEIVKHITTIDAKIDRASALEMFRAW